MLTKVILEGPMGKEFGREWELEVGSANEALRMIDANKPGVFRWIRSNLEKYARYQIVCEHADGVIEYLDEHEYQISRPMKSIRFIPLVEGAGNAAKIIVGIVLIVVGAFTSWCGGEYLIYAGVALIASGLAGMLMPKPKGGAKLTTEQQADGEQKSSYFFDGPVNTTGQGDPVQLVYGRVLVGSHTISASSTVDQLM